jgi:P27 family predicted phage terminase small subunit
VTPGPKPTPTETPDAITEPPKPPTILKGRAKAEWVRIVPELIARKTFTTLDQSVLLAYCLTLARWLEAERIVAAQGAMVKTKSGAVIQHPALAVANAAQKLHLKAAAELGLTPSARSRLKMQEAEADDTGGVEMPG